MINSNVLVTQRRLLPSISMLLAFDAAARNGSFTAAARELNLTQGAISRQIGALENQLDLALFVREGKSVRLTEAGRVYAQDIHPALVGIRNASLNAMTGPLSGILNLAILPTFGTRWLMPRLPDFLADNPDITVNFTTKLAPFDFAAEDLHAAIHFGLPDWPGADSVFLMNEESIPVAALAVLDQHSVKTAADVARLPLLHLTTRRNAWTNWFLANGLEPADGQGMVFEQFSIIAQAAVAGLGAALLPKFLIQSELDRGELQLILDLPQRDESSYYLITPADKSDYPPVRVFRDWLIKAISADKDAGSER